MSIIHHPFLLPSTLARTYYPDWVYPRHIERFQEAALELVWGHLYRLLVSIPVRHGKSAFWSVVLPAWHVLNKPDDLVLIASSGSDLAEEFSKQALEIVREAAPIIGLEIDPNWQARGSWRLRGHRGGVEAAGAGTQVNGRGFGLAIGDDLTKDEEAARSPSMRSSLMNWIHGDLIRRMEPDGRIAFIMSRKHLEDPIGQMLKMNAELPARLKWQQILFKAIDDDGRALWPERYPIDVLLGAKRELEVARKSHFWSSMYQQNPRSDPAACEWPDPYFTDIFFTAIPPNITPRLKIVCCDPSKSSKSKAGDYSAVLTLILDNSGTLWVADAWLWQCPLSECVEQFAATIIRERPQAAIIETMLGAELAIMDAQRLLDAADNRTPLYPYNSMENKNVRIRVALTGWLAKARLKVCDTVGGRLGVGQMMEFPSAEHDDFPDALAQGISLMDALLG
jgi:hypothetical protein